MKTGQIQAGSFQRQAQSPAHCSLRQSVPLRKTRKYLNLGIALRIYFTGDLSVAR